MPQISSTTTPAGRADHHTRALTAFAAHLPDPVTPAGPLLVHMHALLTVCGAEVVTTGDAVRERILDAVLDVDDVAAGEDDDRVAVFADFLVPPSGALPASRRAD